MVPSAPSRVNELLEVVGVNSTRLIEAIERAYRDGFRAALALMVAGSDKELVDAVVKADFLIHCVYGGYTDEVKEREWMRMRNIEVNAFLRRLRSLAAKLGEGEG